MKIVHLSIIFLIIAMKAAVFFLQIYWIFRYPMPSAITSKLQLFPLISLFFLSFKRKWQVPSATVNRVLLSQIPIELSLLLKRYWKFFKKWFIHQERKTNFCPPRKWQRAIADCLLPEGFWFSIRCLCTQ